MRTRYTAGQPAYIETMSDSQIEGIIVSLIQIRESIGYLNADQTARLTHYEREKARRTRRYRAQGGMP